MTLHDQKIPDPCINWWIGVTWITFGLLWCFYQLFGLSFWWHPFTAEDPVVSKWCSDTFLQSCSDEETNSFTLWCHIHTAHSQTQHALSPDYCSIAPAAPHHTHQRPYKSTTHSALHVWSPRENVPGYVRNLDVPQGNETLRRGLSSSESYV